MDDLKSKIGFNLRKLRIMQDGKLSQADVADYADISTRYYCDIENGKKLPSLYVLYKIAKSYKMSLSELIQLLEN